MGFLLRVAAFVFFGYVVWLAVRPNYTMKIVVNEGDIQSHKGLPRSQENEVLNFFRELSDGIEQFVVYAKRERDGRLRVVVKGPVSIGMRQQIRNFLISVL